MHENYRFVLTIKLYSIIIIVSDITDMNIAEMDIDKKEVEYEQRTLRRKADAENY